MALGCWDLSPSWTGDIPVVMIFLLSATLMLWGISSRYSRGLGGSGSIQLMIEDNASTSPRTPHLGGSRVGFGRADGGLAVGGLLGGLLGGLYGQFFLTSAEAERGLSME